MDSERVADGRDKRLGVTQQLVATTSVLPRRGHLSRESSLIRIGQQHVVDLNQARCSCGILLAEIPVAGSHGPCRSDRGPFVRKNPTVNRRTIDHGYPPFLPPCQNSSFIIQAVAATSALPVAGSFPVILSASEGSAFSLFIIHHSQFSIPPLAFEATRVYKAVN